MTKAKIHTTVVMCKATTTTTTEIKLKEEQLQD